MAEENQKDANNLVRNTSIIALLQIINHLLTANFRTSQLERDLMTFNSGSEPAVNHQSANVTSKRSHGEYAEEKNAPPNKKPRPRLERQIAFHRNLPPSKVSPYPAKSQKESEQHPTPARINKLTKS